MLGRLCFLAAYAGAGLICAGCGDGTGHYPVSGKVLHDGAPAVGAVVYFHPRDGAEAENRDLIPSGIADDEGRFRVSSDLLGPGAPAGTRKQEMPRPPSSLVRAITL